MYFFLAPRALTLAVQGGLSLSLCMAVTQQKLLGHIHTFLCFNFVSLSCSQLNSSVLQHPAECRRKLLLPHSSQKSVSYHRPAPFKALPWLLFTEGMSPDPVTHMQISMYSLDTDIQDYIHYTKQHGKQLLGQINNTGYKIRVRRPTLSFPSWPQRRLLLFLVCHDI